MRGWLARNAGGRNAANVRRHWLRPGTRPIDPHPPEVARARPRRYESPPPFHADRLRRDLRLPDERGRHGADARAPRRPRLHAHRGRRGRRRDPAQRVRHPRARRGARPRPPGRAGPPQAPPARRASRRDRLHGAASAREARRARALGRRPGRTRRLPPPARAAPRRRRRPACGPPPRPFRDLRRPPRRARGRRARLGHGDARLRPLLHLLHRALRARARAEPPGPRARRAGASARRGRRARGRLPRADGERLPRRGLGLRGAPPPRGRGAGHPPHPLHVAASLRHEPARHRGHGALPAGRAAAPPAGAVGLRSRARPHGPRVHGGRVRGPGRPPARARARPRALDRRDRRFPRRGRGRLRLDRGAGPPRALRLGLPLQVLAARGHARLEMGRHGARRREGAPPPAPGGAAGVDLGRDQPAPGRWRARGAGRRAGPSHRGLDGGQVAADEDRRVPGPRRARRPRAGPDRGGDLPHAHRKAGDRMTQVTEVAPDLFRISTFVPEADLTFNQFLVRDDEPLLFHTGLRKTFPVVRAAVARVIDPARVRWIGFSHFEADECGALNDWLALAPRAQAACGVVGAVVSVDDVADRPARPLSDGEVIVTGRYRWRYCRTPHVPHGWDAGLLFEETERTLLCSDLLQQNGEVEPLTTADVIGRFRDALLNYQVGAFANYLPYTPMTDGILANLAALQPKTLATMHGSTFVGDGARALGDCAAVFREVLGGERHGAA